MERVCFLGQVRPERLGEYRARHREVWPQMTAAATAAPMKDSAGSPRSSTWTEPGMKNAPAPPNDRQRKSSLEMN
jgi:L-rhamnose mutarotase